MVLAHISEQGGGEKKIDLRIFSPISPPPISAGEGRGRKEGKGEEEPALNVVWVIYRSWHCGGHG